MNRSSEHITDKKRLLQKQDHLTRPPRLEGVVKEAMMQPIRKKKNCTHCRKSLYK